MCTGNEKERIPAALFGSISNVIMNALLIPISAGAGAAVASVISEGIVNGYQLVKMRTIVDIQFDRSILYKSIISSIFMGAICFFIGRINTGIWISTVITVISGIAAYIGMNLILKNEMLFEIMKTVKEKILRRACEK